MGANTFAAIDGLGYEINFQCVNNSVTGIVPAGAQVDTSGAWYSNTYGLPVRDATVQVGGYYQGNVQASAGYLTTVIGTAIPTGARMAWLQPENGMVRFRDDATTPTATVGFPIALGVSWPYIANLASLSLISTTGANVVMSVLFYK
jgi:hypothetical protein